MAFNVKEYLEKMKSMDFHSDEIVRRNQQRIESGNRGVIDESLIYHGLSMKELFEKFEKEGIHGSFDYPGGYEQFKEDVLSGKYDDENSGEIL